MRHSVVVNQLMSDAYTYLNVIGGGDYIGVWTYPHDAGGHFVRLCRSKSGDVALLSFATEETMLDFFTKSQIWTMVKIPELADERL